MDVFAEFSRLVLARSKNPREVWDAFCNSGVGVFGPPQSILMDEGEEWKDDVWAELRSEPRFKICILMGWHAPLDLSASQWSSARNLQLLGGRSPFS